MKSLYNRITDRTRDFILKWHLYFAGGMLTVMFGLGVSAMAGNSAIVDEVAHIPAAYSYLHYGDYRLNPEHPPLIKDLAGLPLQFMNLKFPDNKPSWTTDVNGQWDAGWDFLYHLGNNADAILMWARLPIFMLAIGFGAFLYWFCRRKWGTAVALITLFFYCLSPNLLAHSSVVTTDLGASVFIFLAIATFARFTGKPQWDNILLLSLALAAAQLAKFSSALLYPLLAAVTLALVWLAKDPKTTTQRLKAYTGGFLAASGLSVLWIWLYYIPHTWNMPVAVQDRLIQNSLWGPVGEAVGHVLVNLNNVEIFKPLVHYVLGLTMVFGRVAGGNITYFNGEVTNQSFHTYFPQLFLLKTQVALVLLMIVAAAFAIRHFYAHRPFKPFEQFAGHFRTHVLEWTLGAFAVFYFLISVMGNLNLGIRHILPIYIPIFILVAIVTVRRVRMTNTLVWRRGATAAVALLLVWYGGSTVVNHPHYFAYFNELIGGPGNSYKYFSDSSVDWGQDLKRLKTYVDEHPEVSHVAVDYFGGAIPEYYFCDRRKDERGLVVPSSDGYDCSNSKFEAWHSQYGEYKGQYIAVSETFLENDRWYAPLNGTPGYEYLRAREPIAKIGYSIYLYKLY